MCPNYGLNSLATNMIFSNILINTFKDTHKENAPSNKTEGLTKTIWLVGALNPFYIRGSYSEFQFSKK